ncbi:PREDICTED: iron-sulfur cluster co-chaperone protein HscB, mitochondrial [Cyphomyrmex costatus]|uniref:Iron-sulfur cluster co-chaperone protein HscB, mitochondrial n=1 Tax=Cyphomyrmex costatus TaxID=456900 RepID=A0A195CN34_9HYME|nr:PREDICTED: iron-sulfur cluster co-chaperone protein HscB, mitochondrial [Cyphomyrmex costatus]XP_018396425.1 PREDICTED: iron-sulfur cluster co-chaperone protein HscB, mitochondrial [Cyphomyrmex costatus]XP_018396426.1 PREDICTED: iron-sulfur cluster co-chaperone protein HscB, mitochondrial [Cyphomyrmex costatus]XP_018396427.1 PREDICTED: iron-sulfur cluster co-chaperone protein HscB, mitochondrial [Cyphomyrmex costatus]KYN01877.1 Iron-sulfur cluster co-chaperone protein HscB, mitochondrial [Cy
MFLARVIRKSAVAMSPMKQKCKLYSHHAPSKTTIHSTIPLGSLRFCSDSPPKCWNCDYVYKSKIFCSKCKVLQELPQNLNYFEIMGIKKNYNVIDEEIHRKYRELQKMLHPDKFSNKSEKERQISEKLSSLINKAYSTLMHPLKRGLYLLQLKGISIPEGTTSLNPEFLIEIMERNEEIENAIENKDKVLKLTKESKELLNKMSKQVAEAFSKEDIETATKILIKMKYYDTIYNRLKKLKHDLGIIE